MPKSISREFSTQFVKVFYSSARILNTCSLCSLARLVKLRYSEQSLILIEANRATMILRINFSFRFNSLVELLFFINELSTSSLSRFLYVITWNLKRNLLVSNYLGSNLASLLYQFCAVTECI